MGGVVTQNVQFTSELLNTPIECSLQTTGITCIASFVDYFGIRAFLVILISVASFARFSSVREIKGIFQPKLASHRASERDIDRPTPTLAMDRFSLIAIVLLAE